MVKTCVLAAVLPVATAGMVPVSGVVTWSVSPKAVVDVDFGLDESNCSADAGDHMEMMGKSHAVQCDLGQCSSPAWDFHLEQNSADREEDELRQVQAEAQEVISQFHDLTSRATKAANAELKLAQQLWLKLRINDPGAAEQMQLAKRSAATLFRAAQRAGRARAELETYLLPDTAAQSPFELSKHVASARETLMDVWKLYRLSCPELEGASGKASELFQSAMAFVNAAHEELPMTCTGTVVGEPLVVENFETCAAACGLLGEQCAGFAYYPAGLHERSLCFMLSDFHSGRYYTGCNTVDEIGSEPSHPKCMAKASRFTARSLHPREDGSCQTCFADIQSATRCWQ